MPVWIEALMAAPFSLWGNPVTWLEIVAFVLSLAMVGANMKVSLVNDGPVTFWLRIPPVEGKL